MKQNTVLMMVLSGICFLPACFPQIYHISQSPETWTVAREKCRSKYTDLATIETKQDVLKIRTLTKTLSYVWIGLHADTESWRWSLENQNYFNAQEAGFRMWDDGEPSGSEYYKICVKLQNNGKWTVQLCETPAPLFCYNEGTSSFIYVNLNKTWKDAQSYCREHYTDLASVRNQSENEQLKNMLNSASAWIGFYRNSWKWSDGSAYLLDNWAPKNPSSLIKNTCAGSFSGKWYNVDCNDYWNYVCYTVQVKKVVKLVLKKSDSSVNMEEVKGEILEKLIQKLKEQNITGNVKLNWVNQPDGTIFSKKNEESKIILTQRPTSVPGLDYQSNPDLC
ncbi:hypothetical protein ACER0C_014803 [Sarotherodon galilaeus]